MSMTRVRARSITVVLLTVAAVLAGATRKADAQEPPVEDEAAVRALLQAYYRAYAGEDIAAVQSLWSQKVPGLERLMAAFGPTLARKDFSFANIVVSRIELKPPIATARLTVDATIADLATETSQTEKWARNFMCVKDTEGWRVWRDSPAVDDVAVEIRTASSAAQAAAIVEREPDLPAGEISQALFGLGNRLRTSGMPDDAREVYRLSEQVAERSGDPVVVAQSLTNVGVNAQLVADYDRALECFERALALFERTGDKARIAGAESNVGNALYLKRQYPEAITHLRKALEYYEAEDHRSAMASTLHSIGNAQYLTEDLGGALDSYEKSLALRRTIPGDVLGEANTLQAIGLVQKEQGDYDAAREAFTASFARHDQYGNKAGMGMVLASLGDVHRLMGDFTPALDCYFRSLPLLTEMGDRETLASTFADIAERVCRGAALRAGARLLRPEPVGLREDRQQVGDRAGRRGRWERCTSRRASTASRWRSTERSLELFEEIEEQARHRLDAGAHGTRAPGGQPVCRGAGRLREGPGHCRGAERQAIDRDHARTAWHGPAPRWTGRTKREHWPSARRPWRPRSAASTRLARAKLVAGEISRELDETALAERGVRGCRGRAGASSRPRAPARSGAGSSATRSRRTSASSGCRSGPARRGTP